MKYKCDCDQSYDVHPPGYHDTECSIWGPPYIANVRTAVGRLLKVPFQTKGGATTTFAALDQRDGFEVAFFSCESNASQAPASSMPSSG